MKSRNLKMLGCAALAGLALAALPLDYALADGRISALLQAPVKNQDPRTPAPPPVIVQDYEPNPAIWRLSDEDTTIYMFGTFHILPVNFRWRTEQFDRIVAESEELIVESSDDHLETPEFEAKMIEVFTDFDSRTPTSEKLSPEAAEKWLKLAEISGLPPFAFDRIPPMIAMLGLGLGFSYEAGSTSEAGVETVLEAEFAAAGKPIGSIEDPLPVMINLLSIDEALLLDALEHDLADWDGESVETLFGLLGGEESDTPFDPFESEHLWARGEVSEEEMFGDTPIEKAMHKVLLTDRNRAWAVWLDERLDRPGTILVAVGGGHFEGRDSVQNMLAERGLVLERIN